MESNFIELHDLPVYEDLLDEFFRLVDPEKGSQVCLNSIEGREDDIYFGAGSLKYDWANTTFTETGEKIVPLRNPPLREKYFTKLCNHFKNTKFEKVYDALNEKYHLGRVRVMISYPGTCLSWHEDGEDRIHFPMYTQEGCFMVIEDEVKHLEKNKWYYTKTLKKHTAFNASKDRRIHLVANIRDIR